MYKCRHMNIAITLDPETGGKRYKCAGCGRDVQQRAIGRNFYDYKTEQEWHDLDEAQRLTDAGIDESNSL